MDGRSIAEVAPDLARLCRSGVVATAPWPQCSRKTARYATSQGHRSSDGAICDISDSVSTRSLSPREPKTVLYGAGASRARTRPLWHTTPCQLLGAQQMPFLCVAHSAPKELDLRDRGCGVMVFGTTLCAPSATRRQKLWMIC